MIELTVRTLDSQNHPFTVEDDITVAQFKQKIADTVNIPAETQRIIYCGRVLNDEAKLSEFDVNGKVVHLVERAPPSENQQRGGNGQRAHSPQPQQRVFGGGNAMYLGSMAIPLEHQNIMPPPPSHSLAASRLNVARRMLRRAEGVINLLENPSARPADTVSAEETQEEVTPVFEARVIVPTTSNEPIDEAFVLNAVQNSLLNAANSAPSSTSSTTPPVQQATTSTEQRRSSTPMSSPPLTTPEGVSPISTSTEDLTNETRTENGLAENASRTTEMADLLQTLNSLQARFAPFLLTYTNFMRGDPAITEDIRMTQATMNRVSEVLHFLGHAYHSLSDIIIRVRDTPPRPLLCRPILIQHSAVLQAGFPIQVEAQINFSPDNASSPATPTNNTNTTQPSAPQSENTNNTNPPNSSTPNPPGPNITMNPNLFSFPFMPPSGVHIQSFPVGIRAMRPNSGNRPATATSNPPSSNNQPAPNDAPSTTTTTSSTGGNFGGGSFNNPNVEFFMEVTPESITIDSLETTLLGGAQSMQGGAPPPELLQSIVQIASHLVNRSAAAATNVNPQAAATTAQAADTTQSPPNTTNSGQNSQARGNTQTHPTTATHTRSTARPHVHLAQHAMQGFDPFLPCNSHHISHRRRAHAQPRNITVNTQATNNNTRAQNGNTNPNQFNPVYNIVQGILSSLQNIYGRRNAPQGQATAPASGAAPAAPQAPGAGLPMEQLTQLFSNVPNLANILPHIQNINNTDPNARGPTIAQILQSGEHVEGEGIFNDLIMLLSRNFTIGDVLQLNSGRLDPLMRIRNELRSFITTRLLEGNPTPTNMSRGVNRLMSEMQPFLEHLSHLQVRDNIDIVRSTQLLLRNRLPNILNFAVSRTPNSYRFMVEQLRYTSRHLCALILYASSNGQRGVEEVLSHIVTRYMDGIAPDMQQWTIIATRTQLQQFMRSLHVPPNVLQRYLVRSVDSVTTPNDSEPMDLDIPLESELEQASGSTSVLGVINLEGGDDLPAVVIGSEPWHGQVPNDWVPIITRDTQRQRRQNQQSAVSDAYLAGMPSKRRKIVTNNKPQGSLPQVISESVRRAVTATGMSNVGNLETVSQEAGSDLNIQSAYRDLLRSRVQSSIQDNEDFTPERYPNATNYFNKSHVLFAAHPVRKL